MDLSMKTWQSHSEQYINIASIVDLCYIDTENRSKSEKPEDGCVKVIYTCKLGQGQMSCI